MREILFPDRLDLCVLSDFPPKLTLRLPRLGAEGDVGEVGAGGDGGAAIL